MGSPWSGFLAEAFEDDALVGGDGELSLFGGVSKVGLGDLEFGAEGAGDERVDEECFVDDEAEHVEMNASEDGGSSDIRSYSSISVAQSKARVTSEVSIGLRFRPKRSD